MNIQPLKAQQLVILVDNDSNQTQEELHKLTKDVIAEIEFEKALDLGFGNMQLILDVANQFNDKHFVLEDIDSALCNKRKMLQCINDHGYKEVDSSKIQIVTGTRSSTGIVNESFDLIIMSSMVHLIAGNDSLWNDLRSLISPNGVVMISDAFYPNKPKAHPGCDAPFLSFQELEELIKTQKLSIEKEWRLKGIKTKSNGAYEHRILLTKFKES